MVAAAVVGVVRERWAETTMRPMVVVVVVTTAVASCGENERMRCIYSFLATLRGNYRRTRTIRNWTRREAGLGVVSG